MSDAAGRASSEGGAPDGGASEAGGGAVLNEGPLRRFLRAHAAGYRANKAGTRLWNTAAVVATVVLLARGGWGGGCVRRLKVWLVCNAVATVVHAGLHFAARVNAGRRSSERASAVVGAIRSATVLCQLFWAVVVIVGVVFTGVYQGCREEAGEVYVLTAVLSVGTLILSQAYASFMFALMFTEGAQQFRLLAQGNLGSTSRPASAAEIQSLGVVPFSRDLFEDEADCTCAICLCPYDEGDQLRFLPCRETVDRKEKDRALDNVSDGSMVVPGGSRGGRGGDVNADGEQESDGSGSDEETTVTTAVATSASTAANGATSGAAPVPARTLSASPAAETRKRSLIRRASGAPNKSLSALSIASRRHSSQRPARRGHGFHVECIDVWLVRQRQCPTCRQDIVPSLRPAPEGPSPLTNALRRAMLTGSAADSAADLNSDAVPTDVATAGTETQARSLESASEAGHVVLPILLDGGDDVSVPGDGEEPAPTAGVDVAHGLGDLASPPSPPNSPAPLTLTSNPPPSS